MSTTGGIVSIDPQTYATSVVLDDGDAKTHPYGMISGMLMASPTKGYFVGYDGWGDNTLYPFNPTTGEVGEALKDFKNVSIAGMESGTYLDKNNMMWVCNQTDGTVDIVDTADNSLNEVWIPILIHSRGLLYYRVPSGADPRFHRDRG